MKVCTDSCIFGAWTANLNLQVNSCLEIGAGTGLLSLMYVQNNNNCIIDALEIEENACVQATENFNNSEWKERLNLICTDAKNYNSNKKYDLIFANPPFFQNDLLSYEKQKNLAKHNEGLRLSDLLNIIQKHLQPTGSFCLMLPPERALYFKNLAKRNSFFLTEKLVIKNKADEKIFREMVLYGQSEVSLIENELTIKEENDEYTNEFKQLLKDYYLQF